MTHLAHKICSAGIRVWAFLVCLALTLPLQANPYQTQVLLEGEHQQQSQAIQAALQKVLVKVSGNKALAQNNDLSFVLEQADAYVSEFAYIEKPSPQIDEFTEPKMQPWLQVSFQQNLIQALLRQLQQPIWLHKRPKVLVLVALPDVLLNAESQPQLSQHLEAAAEARGLPIVLPLWDFGEQAAFPIAQVRSFNSAKLQAMQQAYNADAVLVARLTQLSNGLCLAKWQYQQAQSQLRFIQDQQQSCEQLISLAIDKVSDDLAKRSSVQASSEQQGVLSVQIDNLKDYQDYVDLMAYLTFSKVKLLLANTQLQHLEGQSMVFNFNLQGSRAELAKLFAQERRLIEADGSAVAADWHLIWQPQPK